MDLRGDQPEEKLVISAQKTRRVDNIRVIDGVQNIGNRYLGPEHFRRIDDDMKFWNLSTLDQYGRDSRKAVQTRFDIVRGDFPKIRLRNFVRGQAVSNNGKTGEIGTFGVDLRCRRKTALNARYCCIGYIR